MSPLGDEPTAAAHNRVVIAKGKLKVVAFPVGTLDIFPHCYALQYASQYPVKALLALPLLYCSSPNLCL